MISFPSTRLRRNRRTEWSRKLVAENVITPSDLVLVTFVVEGSNVKQEIPSMPGVFRLSIDNIIKLAKEAHSLGIPAIAIFPSIDVKLKDEFGSEAFNQDALIYRTIKEVKNAVPEIGLSLDVALDPYTSHGHDGVLDEDGYVNNDRSKDALVKQAMLLTKAGADIIAPSDMMDGRILAIRNALESENYHNTLIMAYSAKYKSSFYGPFRDAVQSKSLLGSSSKATYQMDMANSDEALREVMMDVNEGADIVMAKPGMPYLDIVRRVKDNVNVPIFSFQVSGEYAQIKFASMAKALDEREVFIESIMAFKRAGCAAVYTYAAIDIAKWLNE